MSIVLPLIWIFLLLGLAVKEIKPWIHWLILLATLVVILWQLVRG